tara:strand:- start:74 stop:916 length:843 start_codon:yes stop_codon:yes gene_type:complete
VVEMSEETFEFGELPKNIQKQIVDDTDPYDIYDEHWFEYEKEYFEEWFNELLGERLGKIEPLNHIKLHFDQPRGQGPFYAYVSEEMHFDVLQMKKFIETADTQKQSGIVNFTVQLTDADKMVYGKTYIAPEMGEYVPSHGSISFGFTVNPSYLRSGEVSSNTTYDNFPLEIDDFTMRFWKDAYYHGVGIFNGYFEDGMMQWDDGDFSESSIPLVEKQVKPVYMWIENTLKPIFYVWFIGVLHKMGKAMTKQFEYQLSEDRVWDYWLNDYDTKWTKDGERV